LTFELAEKSAIGKVEGRWLRLFVAAMGALAIFAPAGRLLRYALDLMHRNPLTIDRTPRESDVRNRMSEISTSKDL
jgi:hypothetical protein